MQSAIAAQKASTRRRDEGRWKLRPVPMVFAVCKECRGGHQLLMFVGVMMLVTRVPGKHWHRSDRVLRKIGSLYGKSRRRSPPGNGTRKTEIETLNAN